MSALLPPMGAEVSLRIHAPVSRVWDLVSDVTRIGEFSPETFEAEWTGDSDGPEVGATFRGHVRRNGVGPVYWAPCKVTVCEPERQFEWGVYAGGRVNNWGYRLAPDGAVTVVTEYFRVESSGLMRVYWLLLGRLRGRTNQRGMRTTLARMKKVLEAEGSAPETAP